MHTDQIKLLLDLADKIKKQERKRKDAVSSLQSAKILNKEEKLTIQFSHLNKASTK